MTDPRRVEIHYRRLPDRLKVYRQRVVMEREDVIVTLSEPIQIEAPMVKDGHVMLEAGSLAVWFTFPDVWHDIGLFHRNDQVFSGVYANILTPPRIEGPVWHTTDLFLDVWCPADGSAQLLDEDEFEEARAGNLMDEETASRARQEADDILKLASSGAWPPQIVGEWTLERSLQQLGEG
jgi:predicted RNA-binding protein associated with RNAse of E/G family